MLSGGVSRQPAGVRHLCTVTSRSRSGRPWPVCIVRAAASRSTDWQTAPSSRVRHPERAGLASSLVGVSFGNPPRVRSAAGTDPDPRGPGAAIACRERVPGCATPRSHVRRAQNARRPSRERTRNRRYGRLVGLSRKAPNRRSARRARAPNGVPERPAGQVGAGSTKRDRCASDPESLVDADVPGRQSERRGPTRRRHPGHGHLSCPTLRSGPFPIPNRGRAQPSPACPPRELLSSRPASHDSERSILSDLIPPASPIASGRGIPQRSHRRGGPSEGSGPRHAWAAMGISHAAPSAAQ